MESLAVKYRPTEFDDVSSQKSIIKILSRQLSLNSFSNCYIFSGPSGCGKTTLARIFSGKINKGIGYPIEIDAASNNGVENVRNIIDESYSRALSGEYKIYIIDECHMLTTQSWNAFLKCIEEPPKYTIFMFCTTDLQKIPDTIKNRCQIFNLNRINLNEIKNRLCYISNQEGIKYDIDALDYISKICNGSMRQGIAYLDKCKDFGDINMNNVLEALGNYSYATYFDLTNGIINRDQKTIINLINDLYNQGTDLKVFIDNYIDFVLDLAIYCNFNDINTTKIPVNLLNEVNYVTDIKTEVFNNKQWYNNYLDKLLEIKTQLKGDINPKTTLLIMLLSISK